MGADLDFAIAVCRDAWSCYCFDPTENARRSMVFLMEEARSVIIAHTSGEEAWGAFVQSIPSLSAFLVEHSAVAGYVTD